MDVRCLPAELHNRPEKIPPAVECLIQENRDHYRTIFVAYGDCGTGGRLDDLLAREGVGRLPGMHCYEFYAGTQAFEAMVSDEVGTFFLTDFLLQQFDRLVLQGLGIDRHPELLPVYFAHYKKLVYLSQKPSQDKLAAARVAACRLGLGFSHRETGYGDLANRLKQVNEEIVTWPN
ncbi:MAG: DUF1638 domain-containing protein [Rhodoferax sp.]|nr:DUF1638 domain-containing protein [Rhodoferax sp.]